MKTVAAAASVAAWLTFAMPGCGRPPAAASTSDRYRCALFSPVMRIALGQVAAGSRFEVTVLLDNAAGTSIRVDSIETTCPCLTSLDRSLSFEPGASQSLSLRVDLAVEPEFLGGMMLGVKGRTPSGETAFDIRVDFDVVAPTEPGRPGPNVPN